MIKYPGGLSSLQSSSSICSGLRKGDFRKGSWQTIHMTDSSNKAKQALIQQLRTVAEQETAWLEKNRLLYTEKRSTLDSLIKLRSASGGEITSEEQKLSKHVALYGFKCPRMWNLAQEVN